MGQEIVVVQQMGDALRNMGYKNIECAVSEIIDNSIEAAAKNVFILLRESIDENTGTTGNVRRSIIMSHAEYFHLAK